LTKETLQTSQNLFGKLLTIAKDTQTLKNDFKLTKNEFNKKYKPSGFKGFKTNESKNASLRRLALDFNEANLPAGKDLTEGYQNITKKGKKTSNKNLLVYGKRKGNIKTKKKGNWMNAFYPYSIWDDSLQSFNQYYQTCINYINKNLDNVQDLTNYVVNSGFQQVLWRVEYQIFDVKNNSPTKGHQYMTFDSGITFGIKTLLQLFQTCNKSFNNWLNQMHNSESGKNTKVYSIYVEILRVKK
jgi:hypothetical protein